MNRRLFTVTAVLTLLAGAASFAGAQELSPSNATAAAAPAPAAAEAPAPPAEVPAAAPVAAAAAAPGAATTTTGSTSIEQAILSNARDYRIGPEDLLDISVWKNPELSRTVPVRPDGKVSLPLVNDMQASGLTPTELRQQLTQRFSEFIPAPEVAVIVREVHSMKVAVVGSVKNPGRYELKSAATVLEMIALSQGLTDFASRDRIVVLRQNGNETKRIPFNYRKVAAGDDKENLVVVPGDIIVVP